MGAPRLRETEVFVSDTIYGKNTPQARSSFKQSDGTDFYDRFEDVSLEFELGLTELAYTITAKFKDTDAESYLSRQRNIFVGKLSYEGEELKSILITKHISWAHFPGGWHKGQYQEWNQNIIHVDEIPKGYSISFSSSQAKWYDSYEKAEKNRTFTFDDVNWYLQDTPPVNSTSVAQFMRRPESIYYPSNWFSRPFDDNIISDIVLQASSSAQGDTGSTGGSSGHQSYSLSGDYSVASIIVSLLGPAHLTGSRAEVSGVSLSISASSWSGTVSINYVSRAAFGGERLEAKQIDLGSTTPAGSILQGGNGNDQLWGKAGWDIIDGGSGNDLIRAGNGRDIITGGLGADELHGDFGWNTFKSEQDGYSDLIAIKSDQFLSNWIYGKAGNNPNGEKADIIEGLDTNDQIKIIGVFSPDITVRAGATAHGVSGIGIYAKGALEALYTGGDLSVAQLTAMTSGDGSAAALNNQVSSYGWTGV